MTELSNNTKQRYLGVFLALTGAVMFSTKAVLVKLAYQYDVDAVSLLMLRMLISLPFFVIIGWYTLYKDRNKSEALLQHKWKVILLGFIGYYIASYLDLEGLNYIDASLERIILFVYPTLVVIFSYLIYQIPIKKIQIWAILLTYIGIVLAFRGNLRFGDSSQIMTGAIYVIGSAVTYSLYLVGTGDLAGKIGTKVYNSAAMTVACIAILIHNYILNGFNVMDFSSEVYFYAFLISIIGTVLPSYLIVEGIRIIGANNSSIIGSVGPISTIILAVIFLGEKISWMQGVGSLIVIGGVLVIMLSKDNKKA